MTSKFAVRCTPAPSAPAAGQEVDTSFSGEPGVSRACDDHQALEQRPLASRTRQRTGRRRFADPTSCEPDRAAAAEEFMRAMHEYRQRSGRMFPTWSEVLEVLQGLGYEKTSGRSPVHDLRCTTSACR